MITYKVDATKENGNILELIAETRGIEDISSFLYPDEENLIDYDTMVNIDKAYSKLEDWIQNEETITIIADSDCDGETSTAVIFRYLKNFTSRLRIKRNTGKKHGISDLDMSGVTKCIIVDSIDEYEVYAAYPDIDFIILDHHKHGEMPDNVTLVSSMDSKNPALSGSGVVWKFCKYCDMNNFTNYADDLVVYAGVGIIGDMMDLSVPENRYICSEAFKHNTSPAIKQIMGGFPFNSKAVSFSIAPLINAAMRMKQNDLVKGFFTSDNELDIKLALKKLKDNKAKQDEIVEGVDLSKMYEGDKVCVLIGCPNEFCGVVANKIAGKYGKPAIVINEYEDCYAGSMRGCDGIEDFSILLEQAGATVKGHENSAGVVFEKESFDETMRELERILSTYEFKTDDEVDFLITPKQIKSFANEIMAINKISGKGFNPIRVCIDLKAGKYKCEKMKNGTHYKLIMPDRTIGVKWKCKGEFPSGDIRVVGTIEENFLGIHLAIDYFEKIK